MNRKTTLALALVHALALSACGMDFDPPSEVSTLRVLGVRADAPYAKPGTDVRLDALVYDGSAAAASRSAKVTWLGACFDPPGDAFSACYGALDPSAITTNGDAATLALPADLISRRATASGGSVPYGVAYAFFAACAGEVRPVPQSQSPVGVPFGCFDPATGAPVGRDGFVAGYATVWASDVLTNANPVVSGASFAGAPATSTVSAARCTESSVDDCAGVPFAPFVDPSSAEDDWATTIPGHAVAKESLWVDYYASVGRFEKDVRVVNDPDAGWQSSYAGSWQPAPGFVGTAHLWAVVHDSRGGTTWIQQDVEVR